MNSITPSLPFYIVRQLDNSADPSAYYLQAIVKSCSNEKILATINLTHLGNQRFKGSWNPPADPTGQGFYVDITVSVYSDSGYSILSPVYSTTSETYRVVQSPTLAQGFSGGSYSTFDEKASTKVRDIVQEELKKIAFPEIKTLSKDDIREIIDDALSLSNDDVGGIDEIKKSFGDILSKNEKSFGDILSKNEKSFGDILSKNEKSFGAIKIIASKTDDLVQTGKKEIADIIANHEKRLSDMTEVIRGELQKHIKKIFDEYESKRMGEIHQELDAHAERLQKFVDYTKSIKPAQRGDDFIEMAKKFLQV